MKIRALGFSLFLLAGGAGFVQAQNGNPNDNRLLLPPLTTPDTTVVAPPSASPPAVSPPTNIPPATNPPLNLVPIPEPMLPSLPQNTPQNIEEEKKDPYQYPQKHMFQQPVQVGPDQLKHHTGYWQPGGYQTRDGSPFMNSVPGAPPRGPISGGGADSAGGAAAAAPNAMPQGYPQGAMGTAPPSLGLGLLSPGYGEQPLQGLSGYNVGGFAQSALNVNGGLGQVGAGNPAGDPYQYHFGPGYYRNGEYGHNRFPNYSYRRPWFHPGFSGYNRDVNLPW